MMVPIMTSQTASTCRRNSTYATLINSDSYVGAALCLRAQLRRVRSACPLLLLFDDRLGRMSAEAVETLRNAFGTEQMTSIATLASASSAWTHEQYPRHTSRMQSGRRLYAEVSQTHAKVFVWALPFERVVYLDLDVLLLANIDDVFEVELTPRQHLAATACPGSPYFVAGFMLLRPHASEVGPLLAVTRFAKGPWFGRLPVSLSRSANDPSYWTNICHPNGACPSAKDLSCSPAALLYPNASDPLWACMKAHRGHFSNRPISKACASKLGDQSIHNFRFRRRWRELPAELGLNVDGRRWPGNRHAATEHAGQPRMLHFFGEPKPFDARAKATLPAVTEYRRICPYAVGLLRGSSRPTLPTELPSQKSPAVRK